MLPLLACLLVYGSSALQVTVTARPSAAAECRDAVPGEWCYSALVWAQETGVSQYPEWFPGDSLEYTAWDLQSLLHQRGRAGCAQPCAAGDSRRPAEVGLLQAGSARSHHGLNRAELEELMFSTWEPAAPASIDDSPIFELVSSSSPDCEDAKEGSLCQHAIGWLRRTGFQKHPEWYPGLTADSDDQEVQGVLHMLKKAECKKPCESVRQESESYRNPQNDEDQVLEVDHSGREIFSEAHRLSAPEACGNSVVGDWCYDSIQWLRNVGFIAHPDWYPSLNNESSDREVQTELHRQGKVSCPQPCPIATPVEQNQTEAPEEAEPTQLPPTARVQEDCHDAEEDSTCFIEVMQVQKEGIRKYPERFAYHNLTNSSSFSDVQEYLYQHGKGNCPHPCAELHEKPKFANNGTSVKKAVQKMTMQELKDYLDGTWDGYLVVTTSASPDAVSSANHTAPEPWFPEEPWREQPAAPTESVATPESAVVENATEEANHAAPEPWFPEEPWREQPAAPTKSAATPESAVVENATEEATAMNASAAEAPAAEMVPEATVEHASAAEAPAPESAPEEALPAVDAAGGDENSSAPQLREAANATEADAQNSTENATQNTTAEASENATVGAQEADTVAADLTVNDPQIFDSAALPFVDNAARDTSPAQEAEEANRADEAHEAIQEAEQADKEDRAKEADQEAFQAQAENATQRVEEQANATQPAEAEEQANATQPTEEQATAAPPAEEQATASQPAEERANATQPAAAEEQATATQPAEEQASATQAPAAEDPFASLERPAESTSAAPAQAYSTPGEPLPQINDQAQDVDESSKGATVAEEAAASGMEVKDLVAHIKEEVMKEISSVTTTAEETMEERETRIKKEILADWATSTTTERVETEEDIRARMKVEVLKEMADATSTTEKVESEDDIKARMKAEVLRQLEEEKQKQEEEAMRNALLHELQEKNRQKEEELKKELMRQIAHGR